MGIRNIVCEQEGSSRVAVVVFVFRVFMVWRDGEKSVVFHFMYLKIMVN